MDDLDDVVKRYTEECVSLLAESVQNHLKEFLDENAKLKEENERLLKENVSLRFQSSISPILACSLSYLLSSTCQVTPNTINPLSCAYDSWSRRF